MATPDTEPKLGWAASVRSGMWVALVLLAVGVGASSPWGQGIWPEWPTREERSQRVVRRNVHPARQRNTEHGRQLFVQDTILTQREKKKKIDSEQKDREQYEKKKLVPSHPKITYGRPANSPRQPYYNKLKVDLNRRWREYMRRWGDRKNHLVLKLPTIRLVTKHKPYRSRKHKSNRATKQKPDRATSQKGNIDNATRRQHYDRNH